MNYTIDSLALISLLPKEKISYKVNTIKGISVIIKKSSVVMLVKMAFTRHFYRFLSNILSLLTLDITMIQYGRIQNNNIF